MKIILPAQRYASASTSYGPVSVCLCLLQVGILSKGMDGMIWFLARGLISTSRKLCRKEIHVSTKIKVLPSKTFPNFGFRNFHHRISIV